MKALLPKTVFLGVSEHSRLKFGPFLFVSKKDLQKFVDYQKKFKEAKIKVETYVRTKSKHHQY